MAQKNKIKTGEGTKLVAVIGDEDTVTGLLLAGIGERNIKGETNFLVVDSKTQGQVIQDTFKRFLTSSQIAIILVNQHIAEQYLRHMINEHQEIIPTILEIPSKEHPYEPKKDNVMQKANRLLYGSDIV